MQLTGRPVEAWAELEPIGPAAEGPALARRERSSASSASASPSGSSSNPSISSAAHPSPSDTRLMNCIMSRHSRLPCMFEGSQALSSPLTSSAFSYPLKYSSALERLTLLVSHLPFSSGYFPGFRMKHAYAQSGWASLDPMRPRPCD